MAKRLAGLLLLGTVLAVSVLLFSGGLLSALKDPQLSGMDPMARLEQAVAASFPWRGQLRQTRVGLNYLGGGKEQNGVFITGDALMLDVQPQGLETGNDNTLAMMDFTEDYQRPSYVMLIPTACAVQQSKVPYPDITPLYNQKQLIDDVYRRVSGYVTAIDVYPTLSNHQGEYIYYRTHNAATGLGGYYIYTVAARKLGWKPRGIEQFDVDHIDYRYYGDLYRLSPYRAIEPDRVSAYVFSRYSRNYTVTHYDQDGSRRYFTLYPKHRKELGDTMDILLGGMSPVIDISVGSQSAQYKQLLIFSDRSVQSFLPFLLIHYGRVTVVDTTQATPKLLGQLDVTEYNQVLFAYSVDSYTTADQLSVLEGLPPPQG